MQQKEHEQRQQQVTSANTRKTNWRKTSSPASYSFVQNYNKTTTLRWWRRITFRKNYTFSRLPASGGSVPPQKWSTSSRSLELISASEFVNESSERKHVRVSISLSVSSSTIMRYCILKISKLPSRSSKSKNRMDTLLSALTIASDPKRMKQ